MKKYFAVASIGLLAAACSDPVASPEIESGPDLTRSAVEAEYEPIVAMVDGINADLAAAGSDVRLDYPWLFRVGPGTDPFARLRTGAKWQNSSLTYVLDESGYTTDVAFADVDAALQSAFDTWNDVPVNLTANRILDPNNPGDNYDVLDGTFVGGQCVTIFDVTSPNFNPATGFQNEVANIVVGGWKDPSYFISCLGNINILAVTWTFSSADTDGDNYRDRNYVEQFYNPAFQWTTTDAQYLNFAAPVDIETIALHENGHAHGLGHFGGPVNRQPFKLQPNLKVFNPEAAMNPFYLGGEDRVPSPTDVAGMRSMYGSY